MNESIFYFLYHFAHRSLYFDQVIIFTAHVFPFLVILLATVFLIKHHHVVPSHNPILEFLKKWKEIVIVFLASGLAWVIAKILKVLFHTPRPFVFYGDVQALITDTSFAFPSGHATFFGALAVSLFLIHKRVGYVFMGFALLIGVARIAAGVHFPIDILGGFVCGTIVAYGARMFLDIARGS